MPLCHFNVVDDIEGASPDRRGTELPDAVSARREARRLAGATIADRAFSGHHLGRWHLEVTNRNGESLIVMGVLTSSPSAIAAVG